LLRDLIEVSSSPKPFDALELALLAAAGENDRVVPVVAPIIIKTEIKEEIKSETPAEPEKTVASPTPGANFDLTMWPAVLDTVKIEAPALYTALRLAAPAVDGGDLILAFEFPLHQKKVDQTKNKDIVASAVARLSDNAVTIRCIIDKELAKATKTDEPQSFYTSTKPSEDGDQLNTISNIFGSAEVLES
jgi:hypothetical protein